MGNEGDNGGQANENGNNVPPNKRFYKVAFSFTSGEDDINRNFVRKVAEALRDTHQVPQELIFFDEWSEGLNGRGAADIVLAEIYEKRCEFIVPFFNCGYKDSYWTRGVEFESVRAIKGMYENALIPVQLEEGINISRFSNKTNFFIDAYTKQSSPITVAKEIYTRLEETPPRKLIHINEIVNNLNTEIGDFGIKYIELRDIFVNYNKDDFNHKELKIRINHWQNISNPFISTQLEQNLAELLDYIWKYSKENNDIQILLRFLCAIYDSKILRDEHLKTVKGIIIFACQFLNIEYDDLCSSNNKIIFPFTNREKELKNILNSTDNFQLVSAPTGYGKKTFLKRLKKEYEKKKYKVYYQKISDQGVMRNRDAICRQWGYIDAQDFINTLLSDDNRKIITDKGLVLLIATENNVASDLKQLKSQIMLLRKEISTKLEANDDDYHHSDDRTKLIVSASQLFGDPINQLDWPYDFNCNNRLSEFTYQVILKSLKESDYWKLPNSNNYSSLVAKLTLMTAGHPEAVELVARNYRENNHFNFGLIKNVITRISNSFATSIPNKEIKDLFSSKKLPLHRYITNILLSEITDKKERKRDAILDNLYSHGLYKEINIAEENGTRILKDSLLRRMCTIDYCYTDPDKFVRNLNECCIFYSNRLKDLHQPIEHSVLWIIEYWFSFLQGKLLYFNQNQEYKETVDLFENEILKKYFSEMDNLLVNFNKNKIMKFKSELINQLEKDWEFQLLLNFDTNCKTDNECYNQGNYTLFVEKIRTHFDKILSNDTHQQRSET